MRRPVIRFWLAALTLAATMALAGAANAQERIADHYKLYSFVRPPVPAEDISLTDQFGREDFRLGRPLEVGLPVQKFRESGPGPEIQRPDEHLKCYRVRGPDRRIQVRVFNQLRPEGSRMLVRDPRRMCTPALKNPEVGAPPNANHYKCYGVSAEQLPRVSEAMGLRDQFGDEATRVDRALFLCNPATKVSRHGTFEPPFPEEHLVCYRLVSFFPFAERDVLLRDQFGDQTLTVRSPRALCVPSRKEIVAPRDAIIDADGTASPQSGDPAAREVTPGTALANFPTTTFNDSGLDMFDQDGNQAWTLGPNGDDLHAEGPTFCPTAIRNGVHELGFDCKVLDINGDLANGDQVDCDLEVGFSFSGMPCPPPGVRYHDANGNGAWDDGEDIVLDQNNNGVFD
jgi:hypothetical protein